LADIEQVERDTRGLLAAIIADFVNLRQAYTKVGILGETNAGSAYWRLLGDGEEGARFQRTFFLLDALIRHRVVWLGEAGDAFRHVAVFGGNNVGKSTVINILAQASVAGASPEGGHTRQAEAFLHDGRELFRNSPFAFKPLSAGGRQDVANGDFDRHKVSTLSPGPLPPDFVLWDTPDCDAVGSTRYLASVVEAVTLSDLVVYVTSIEKYAVEHIVEWVFQLNDAGLAILECLNKTPKRDRDLVIRKQTENIFPIMSERLGLSCPTPIIVALRNLTDGEEADLWGPEHPEADELREAVLARVRAVDRKAQAIAGLDFVRRRLDDALMPVRIELEACRTWETAVESATAAFQLSYERDYLTSPTVIEPFTRLNLEILRLLEPEDPRIRQVLNLMRLPSRMVLQVGRRLLNLTFAGSTNGADTSPPAELKAYSDAHTDLLNTLGLRMEAEQKTARHHPFWDIMAESWPTQLSVLTREFGDKVVQQMQATDRTIQAAARDIVEELKSQPNLLALLRGARFTTNVGGSVIGFFLPHHGLATDLIDEALFQPIFVSTIERTTGWTIREYVSQRKTAIIQELKRRASDTASALYREPLLSAGYAAMARAGSLGVSNDLLERLSRDVAQLCAIAAAGRR